MRRNAVRTLGTIGISLMPFHESVMITLPQNIQWLRQSVKSSMAKMSWSDTHSDEDIMERKWKDP